MDVQPDYSVLAQGNFNRLKDMRRTLEGRGIRSEILAPPGKNTNA